VECRYSDISPLIFVIVGAINHASINITKQYVAQMGGREVAKLNFSVVNVFAFVLRKNLSVGAFRAACVYHVIVVAAALLPLGTAAVIILTETAKRIIEPMDDFENPKPDYQHSDNEQKEKGF